MQEITRRTLCDNCEKEIPSGCIAVRIARGSGVIGECGASSWEGDYCNAECFLAAFNWHYYRTERAQHTMEGMSSFKHRRAKW